MSLVTAIGARPHIILIGLPGAGKTTVGRDLARRLGRPFIDLDAEVEHLFGIPTARIFEEQGEGAFRSGEARASEQAASAAPAVIAPGGGWALNAEAVAPLRARSRIIYLRVPPEEALRRMGRGTARRPLLAGADPLAALRALDVMRRAHYERVADVAIETAGLDRASVVARVAAVVGTTTHGRSDDER